MVDRAVWAFASEIELAQETAVGRLPKTAKDATRDFVRQQVLDAFLGIESRPRPTQYREPSPRRG